MTTQVWICPACGRRARTRPELKDTSCVMHGVLCWDEDPPRAVEPQPSFEQAMGFAESEVPA